MTICHSIKLIGYQIHADWQNNCTVLITKDQSSKVCQQVRAAKNARWALHWRSPRVKYYNFQKSPTHFCFTASKECSGQISQKSSEFWHPINSFVCRNDTGSFSRSFLHFSFVELTKLVIHIFFRNLHLLSFPTIYSLPCFPLKWRAHEFFPGGHRKTPAKVRSNLKWWLPLFSWQFVWSSSHIVRRN